MPYLQLPNKQYIEVTPGISYEEALARAKERFPELYGKGQGFVERMGRAAMRGIEQPIESLAGLGLGARAAVGDTEGAQRQMESIKREAAEEAKRPQGLTVEQLQDIYRTQGLGSMLGKVPAYIGEQVLQNAPSMAGPLAAGAYGTAAAGPIGGLAAGIGTYGLQQLGSFMQRQAAEKQRAEELEPGKAALTAAATAPLGFLVDRFALGLGKAGSKAGEAVARELAARSAGRTVATGAAKSVLSEVPTELLETAAERYQAGLSLTDDKAKSEYINTVAGTVAATGPMGGAAAYRQRGQAQEQIGELDNARRIQDQILQQEQQRQQEQAAERQKTIQGLPSGTQPDLFGEVAGAYTPLPTIAQREADEQAKREEEESRPRVLDTYRRASQAFDDIGARMQAATEKGDMETVAKLTPQYNFLKNAVASLAKQSKDVGFTKEDMQTAVQGPQALTGQASALEKAVQKAADKGDFDTVQKLYPKLQQIRTQQEAATGQGGLFDPEQMRARYEQEAEAVQGQYFQPDMFAAQPQDQASQEILNYQDTLAKEKVQRARDAWNAERKQRFADMQLDETSEQAQQLLKAAPLESILAGQRRALNENTFTDVQKKRLNKIHTEIAKAKQTNDSAKLKALYDELKEISPRQGQTRTFLTTQQRAIDNGIITKDAQEMLGLNIPDSAFSLLTDEERAQDRAGRAARQEELRDQKEQAAVKVRTTPEDALQQEEMIALEAVTNDTYATEDNLREAYRVGRETNNDALAAEANALMQEKFGKAAGTKLDTSFIDLRHNRGLNLNDKRQADSAIKALDARIEELEQQRKTEFPSLELTAENEAGQPILTADGKRLVGVEASLSVLKQLREYAQQTQDPGLQKQRARYLADQQAKEREAALFDLANIIDSLRKGEFTGSTRKTARRKARALISRVVDASIKEADYRRQEFDRPAATTDEKLKTAEAITTRLQTLVDHAKTRAVGKELELRTAIYEALKRRAPISEIRKIARELRALRRSKKDVVEAQQSRLEELQTAINEAIARKAPASELKKLYDEMKALRPRQDVIKRGMTIANERTGELAGLRSFVADVTNKLAFPTKEAPKGRVVKGEFTLKPSPAEIKPAVNAEQQQADIDQRIKEMRDEADTYANEQRRLQKQFETTDDLQKKKALLVEGQKYNSLLKELDGKVRRLLKQSNVGPRPGTADITDLFKLSSRDLAAQRTVYVEEQKQVVLQRLKDVKQKINEEIETSRDVIAALEKARRGLLPDVADAGVSADVAAKYEKLSKEIEGQQALLEAISDPKYVATVAKADKKLQFAVDLLRRYEDMLRQATGAKRLTKLQSLIEQQEANAAEAVTERQDSLADQLDKAVEPRVISKTTVTTETMRVKKAPKITGLSAVERAIEDKKYEAYRIGVQLELNKKEAMRGAPPPARLSAAQRLLYSKRLDLLDQIDALVKKAPENAELAGIEKEIEEKKQEVHAIGAQLGLDKKQSMRGGATPAGLSATQRRLNSKRLDLLEQIDTLRSRAVINVPSKKTEVAGVAKEAQKPTATEKQQDAAQQLYNKLIARRRLVMASLKEDLTDSARKTRDAERKALNERIAKLEENAAARGYALETTFRAPAAETLAAQAEAVRSGLAASERKPVSRSAPFKTGSEEQRAEKEQKRKRGRKAKTPEDFLTDPDVSEHDSMAAADYIKHGNIQGREASIADRGVDTKEAQAVADRVKAKLPEGINLVYAATPKQIPAAMMRGLEQQGMDPATLKGAVFPDGSVLVIGEHHKTVQDLEETFAHELIGHYGVDTVLGPKEMKALVDRLFAKGDKYVYELAEALGVYSQVSQTQQEAKDRGMSIEDQRMAVVREMIAHAAEGRRVAPGMVDRVKQFVKDIVSAVRGFFKRFGMDSLVKQDTKYIYNLIKQAERDLATSRLGVYTSPNGETAFRFGAAKMPAGFEKVQEFDQKIIAQGRGLADRIRSTGLLGAKVTYVDQLAAWEELAKNMGDRNAGMQMMYYFQKSLDLLPMASASAYVGNLKLSETQPGVFTIAAEKGPSLRSVDEKLKPLLKMGFNAEGANRLFTAYMASLRGEVEGYNKLQYSPDKIALIKDAVAAIRANKEVKAVLDDARADYNAYNKGLIDFLEQSGAITPAAAKEMRSKRDYIPYYRATRDGVLELFLDPAHPVKVGNLKDSPHLQKLVGGDEQILDYFTSSMQNTLLLTDMSLRNLAIKNAAFTMNKMGLVEMLQRNGKEYGIRNGPGPQSADVLRFKDKGEDKHIVLKTEGTAFEGIPVDLLAKGLEGVSITVPDWLKMLALPAKVLRKGVTLNPLYPYYQLFKDSLAMGATRGNSYSHTINVLSGMKNYVNSKKMMEELQGKGIVSGQMFTGNMEDVAQFRRQILKGQGPIHAAMAWQESRALSADAAVRKMLFDSYIKQGLNERDAEYMTITAMPYNRKGLSPGLRYLSHMIPFFNAQIVGLHSLYQGLRGKSLMEDKLQMKKKLWTSGMMMGLSTLIYASMVGDEDWYKKMPLETRMRNWLIKLPDIEEPIAIPIPFEFGILFKGLWEGAYLGMFNSSPEGKKVREAVKGILVNTIPGGAMPVPTAALPLLELKANKSFFNDAPIESTRDLDVAPDQRFGDGTSELAKSLGETTGMSPKQIDHLIRGYTGPMGVAVAALVSAFTGSESAAAAPEKTLSKYPVLGQLFKNAEGNELVDLAMDTLKEAEQMNKTYTRMMERGDTEKAQAYLEQNIDTIAKGKMAGKLVQVLGQFAAAERSIVADKEMTPIEKRDRIKELRQTRSRIAENFQQAAMSGG